MEKPRRQHEKIVPRKFPRDIFFQASSRLFNSLSNFVNPVGLSETLKTLKCLIQKPKVDFTLSLGKL